jgi:hypothetical protein
MEKLVEDLIIRLESQKRKDENLIHELQPDKDKTLVFLNAGKIIAFDLCISELHRLIEYNNASRLTLVKKT